MATQLQYDDPWADLQAPSALLFGDDEARRARIADLVRERGLRVVASDNVAAAAQRLPNQSLGGILIVDAAADAGDALDALLRSVAVAAARGVTPVLVIGAVATIDVLAAVTLPAAITLLVDPCDEEIAGAVDALASTSTEPRLFERSDEANTRRLAQLSEEVSRIARVLVSLSTNDAAPASARAVETRDSASDLALIRAIIRMRRLREQHFDPALFADPAWDMLLDLAGAEIERRTVAVSSLCIAASVPATTALRWIATMTAHGLLVRRPDPEDGRRVFVALSEQASSAMRGYVAAAARVMAPAR